MAYREASTGNCCEICQGITSLRYGSTLTLSQARTYSTIITTIQMKEDIEKTSDSSKETRSVFIGAMTTAKPVQRPTPTGRPANGTMPRFRSWRSGNRTTDANNQTLHRYRHRDHKKQCSLPSNERNHHRTRPDPTSGSEKVCRVRPLVPVGSTPRGASTSGLSNTCSACGLQAPKVPRNPNLGAGFPLRCFQRLSLPNVANRPCRWRDNRHTRGPSTQVLSYYGQASSGFQRAQRIETKLSHDVLNPARVPL